MHKDRNRIHFVYIYLRRVAIISRAINLLPSVIVDGGANDGNQFLFCDVYIYLSTECITHSVPSDAANVVRRPRPCTFEMLQTVIQFECYALKHRHRRRLTHANARTPHAVN